MGEREAQTFLTGAPKAWVYLRISTRVALTFGARVLRGKLGPVLYVRFLARAARFLWAMRHSKVVRIGRLHRLHLYVPAYPTPAFFHLLEKLVRPEPGPGTVVFSMTKACRYHCPHCYQAHDGGADLDEELMVRVALEAQEAGVALFDVEGGEPFLRPERVEALLVALGARAEVWINSTGDRATPEALGRLRAAGLRGTMVSVHSPDPAVHDAFTGVPGSFETARSFLELCRSEGLFTAINCCPSAAAIEGGDLERLLDLGRQWGCSYVQVIHEKPSGAWLHRAGTQPQGEGVLEGLRKIHMDYNSGGPFAAYPSVSAQVFEERKEHFGCTAGGVDRFYIGASGEVQPCEFLNVSFGNVREEEFGTILRRMRSFFPSPGTDWLCCTQAESIGAAVRADPEGRTPVRWPLTGELVARWERGEETPLYRRLGIYRRP